MPRVALNLRHGAFFLGDGLTRFSVWAPRAERVELLLDGEEAGQLGREHGGYHVGRFPATPGQRYRYLLDGRGPFADPASRSQPEGVHGPSEIVAPSPPRPPTSRPWRGVPLSAQVICELHVGTFSPAGTFDGVAEGLDRLASAGYTAVELMPVAAFPGERDWGYDGVFPFAVQVSYGGREGLARLCAAAHDQGLAVILDVVYNHLGPEGAVLEEYGPFLTDRYRTPWGDAVNLDGEGSDEVRRYLVESALSFVRELDVDGLRLDAVHELADRSASPFVAELAAAIHAESRRLHRVLTVVAESPANDPRLVSPAEAGGTGFDGVWNDDFHHALRVALTGQQDRYFGDYRGLADLAGALSDGFVVAGRFAASRDRHHGARPDRPIGGEHLVVFAQNHDQIGNAGFGRRLTTTLPLEAQFPVAAIVLCSGYVPLRFMGEEYGETAPFHFFSDYDDRGVARATRHGRRQEVGEQTGEEPPDPQALATFDACRPDRSLAAGGVHAELLAWQQRLLELRRLEPALGSLEPERSSCAFDEQLGTLVLLRRADPYLGGRPVAVVVNLSDQPVELTCPLLADCRLDVLCARGAGALTGGLDGGGLDGLGGGGRVTPELDGAVTLVLDGYGVLLASVLEPAEARRRAEVGCRFGARAPQAAQASQHGQFGA